MQKKNFEDLYRDAESHDDYWVANLVQAFTEEISGLMQRDGITRSELARRLGTSPAYITKILRGNANFTLTTMVRLARVLKADLSIQLTPTEASDQAVEQGSDLVVSGGGDRDNKRRAGLAAAPRAR